jgi:hypothetical protein
MPNGVSQTGGMSAVSVAIVGSRTEAELIAGMLRSNGIRAAVSADDAGGWDPQLQTASGVSVLVPAEDVARARGLIGDEPQSSKPLNALQRLLVRLLGGRSPR